MALDADLLLRIRDEIGDGTDYTNANLETIYNDADRGASDAIKTALVVWRKRLADFNARAFDVATAGSLVSRSQRGVFMERRIKDLEFRLPEGDFAAVGANANTQTVIELEDEGTELS